ncbi:unnamed protein product [Brachionus calyciflorus]|uniref:BTB/POZ domain-containing protein 16 n=1 Tax=Brachionus calyciflorus TaxID=104777 RepID=A0A813M3K5_9BILA|nr:unnamed protein product [Brachionus calyciflorus]
MFTIAGYPEFQFSKKNNELIGIESDSFYQNIANLHMSAKKHSESQSSISNIDKPPFLPKLPKKAMIYRKNETHLINDFYLEPEITKSFNTLNQKSQIDFKGDLLKAKQIFLVLNSSLSNSIKHVKSSDTPWARSKSSKPCRSVLIKNKIEPECYIKSQLSPSRTNYSCRQSATSRTFNSRSPLRSKSSSYINKLVFELDKDPSIFKQFAEDLIKEHYNLGPYVKIQDASRPDVALHVFNSIWEIHSYALANSPYLSQLLEFQSNLPPTSEIKLKIKQSKENTRTNIHQDHLDKLNNILLEINNPLIDKHSLAVAIGNLYHPENITVPTELTSGILAAAHYLKFENLISATISKMCVTIHTSNIGSYYQSFHKNNEKFGVEVCEKWLEMNLIPNLGSSIHLREIPLRLLIKTIKSNRLFTENEYNTFFTIITWIFLIINNEIQEIPTESIIITYFSSLSKDKNLIERCPELSDLLYSVRLYGITKANYLHTIQQMNIYPNSYIVQIMMEIQQSLSLGGDMAINRLFDTSALRQGFVLEIENGNFSDVFSIYGFHFEIIAEKLSTDDSNTEFQFYIQRLRTNDPILTYEQSQLEAFSLRNDRFCNYSINVQYWYKGNQVFCSTGKKKQRFGKFKTQQTPVFTVNIPNDDQTTKELFVLYSLLFPPN